MDQFCRHLMESAGNIVGGYEVMRQALSAIAAGNVPNPALVAAAALQVIQEQSQN